MARLADLLAHLPKSNEVHMSAAGHALWITWGQELDPAVPQTLQNYGGMYIAGEHDQSLWFFFSTDVFLALARLSVWARFQSIPVTIVHMPAKLLLGVKREINLSIDSSLGLQEVLSGDGLEIWVHSKTHDKDFNLPGITFEVKAPKQGLARAEWATIEADPRLPYTSTHGWYAVVHPLGSPLDKSFQAGWDYMYPVLDGILQTFKLRSIVHENFVMIAVDNLRLLRDFLREYLGTVAGIKANQRENYWPCVLVIIDRKSLNFNNDLFNKVGLQWDRLMPDFPYLSYRNAYLLGAGFIIQDLRFSNSQNGMEGWCNVVLDESGAQTQSITLLMPGHLSSGEHNCCFFCGMPSHPPHQCPTLHMERTEENVWWNLTCMGLDDINANFRTIENTLSAKGLEGFEELLAEEAPTRKLLEAIFAINVNCQIRQVPHIWLTRGRDFVKNRDAIQPVPKDDSPSWELLEKIRDLDLEEANKLDRSITGIIERNPRDGRVRTVMGFLRVLKNDEQAGLSFRDAAGATTSTALQGWNEFLQARWLEVQGSYSEAIELYDQLQRVLPTWHELAYRQLVCKVKMGFAEQILGPLHELIAREPDFFNRCLIDPELGRGQLLILTSLYQLWERRKTEMETERAHLETLAQQIGDWFPKGHPVHPHLNTELTELQTLSDINNYASFLQVIERRPALEKEVNDNIQREIEELQNRFKHYLTLLQEIRDEASWFPFPKILREFSKEFNEAAGIINWAFASNFYEVDNYTRAENTTKQLDELLRSLKKRLKFLRLVRDSTLFTLTLGRTFFWIEIIGLIICFVGVPGVVLYGEYMGLGWLKGILSSQQWEIQKVLVIVVSLLALGLAALRSTVIFDRKRDALIEEARVQREQMQAARLERIRKQREAEAKALAEEKRREFEREQRRRMEGQDNE